ncbi:hypothetical protein B0H34DRAFT_105597 [Crassisporium funariophilum]|nr:hypothetical protein B0H34DRAFT_105597 [Crassisporium funariophilum]
MLALEKSCDSERGNICSSAPPRRKTALPHLFVFKGLHEDVEASRGNQLSHSSLCHPGVIEDSNLRLPENTFTCGKLYDHCESEHKKAYILVHRPSGRIIESRDVFFDEGSSAGQSRVIIDPTDAPDNVEGAPKSDKSDKSDHAEDEEEKVDPHTSDNDSNDDDGQPDQRTTQGTETNRSVGAITGGSRSNNSTPQTGTGTHNEGPSGRTTQRSANPTSDSDSATSNAGIHAPATVPRDRIISQQ